MVDDITTILVQERAAVEDFIRVLEREQRALIEGDVPLLLELAQEKTNQAEKLNLIAAQRNRCLATLGYSSDPSGIDRWLRDHPSMTGVWAGFLRFVETARQLNQTNGILINERLQHNQRALAVLQAAAGNAGLYGPDGQPTSSSSGRRLGAG